MSDLKELFDYITPYIPESLKEIDLLKGIRLIAIVGGYWVIRNSVQKHLARRQLEQQLKHDEEQKHQTRIEELIEDPNARATGIDDGSFGWGKKTRRNIQKQQEILKQTLENLENQDDDDDADIADLLEDD